MTTGIAHKDTLCCWSLSGFKFPSASKTRSNPQKLMLPPTPPSHVRTLRTFQTVEVLKNALGEIFERCRYLTWLLASGGPDASCSGWVPTEALGRHAYRLSICPMEIKSTECIVGIIIYIGVCTVWVTGYPFRFSGCKGCRSPKEDRKEDIPPPSYFQMVLKAF